MDLTYKFTLAELFERYVKEIRYLRNFSERILIRGYREVFAAGGSTWETSPQLRICISS
jgi:hypothetical protein